MHNQIQPHTISTTSRSCADCHMSKKALGLGGGTYNVRANFPGGGGPSFELERIVDEQGKQIQGTAHEGSRPLNKDEQERIARVGTCVACHGSGQIALKNAAPTDELHDKAIQSLLLKASKKK
jgi:mono/diheme cytochrome c family protein